MSSFLCSVGSKPVRDGDDRLLGRVLASEVDSTGGEPLRLLVALDPPAHQQALDGDGGGANGQMMARVDDRQQASGNEGALGGHDLTGQEGCLG